MAAAEAASYAHQVGRSAGRSPVARHFRPWLFAQTRSVRGECCALAAHRQRSVRHLAE